MKTPFKLLAITLFVLGVSACQNSSAPSPSSKGLSTSFTKAVDSNEPLTVIGGELSYDLLRTIQSNSRLNGIKFNPKNSTLITYGDSSSINIYSMNLELVATIKSSNDEIKAIDISRDGNYLACGGDDGYIEIWSLDSYKLIKQMKGSDGTLAIAFSSDGTKVASGGEEKVIDVWNVNAGEQIARLQGHQDYVTNISLIDYNRKVVSTAKDKNTKIWDVVKKQAIYSYLTPSNEYGKIRKAKSFDDYTITALTEVESAEGNSRRRNGPPVWKYTMKFKDNQGNTIKEFNQHRGPITDIDIASNRAYMASSSEDKTVRLWDLEKKKHITNIVLKDRGYRKHLSK